jgi:hypothetical protein
LPLSPKMTAPGNVSDNQDISLGSLCGSVQQLRDIAAIDDDVGLRAQVLLKLGDLFGGEADDLFLPRLINVRSAGPPDFHAGRMWTSVSVAPTAVAISVASDAVWRQCGLKSAEQRTRRIENSRACASS